MKEVPEVLLYKVCIKRVNHVVSVQLFVWCLMGRFFLRRRGEASCLSYTLVPYQGMSIPVLTFTTLSRTLILVSFLVKLISEVPCFFIYRLLSLRPRFRSWPQNLFFCTLLISFFGFSFAVDLVHNDGPWG